MGIHCAAITDARRATRCFALRNKRMLVHAACVLRGTIRAHRAFARLSRASDARERRVQRRGQRHAQRRAYRGHPYKCKSR
ncbi:hypothetical protein C6T56_26725 [Burkholderia multivorans]|nr:hypothetical protein C6P86_00370 [Burkholderia multivorans]PRE83526.1 hypothetical protein C6Q00_17335 [Burkholderia multivorans]PRG25676.1 hypothetical protein C6T57_06875 [Burkholderia multivorans]PRH09052.1 hypothetical protein C6T60_05265 [Burkholderia multivorans]PRH14234.1 hypothetical protein C6T56_26725 [Burkholderia multivorans]